MFIARGWVEDTMNRPDRELLRQVNEIVSAFAAPRWRDDADLGWTVRQCKAFAAITQLHQQRKHSMRLVVR
jgi:hypothetical protein